MFRRIQHYLIPGLVIQAVLVGGGYATGRELVEFFLRLGPASALMGMALTALLFSAGAMISFELARLFHAYDYHSFTRLFLGPCRVLFEVGYLAGLVLVLAIVSAAAGELLSSYGYPKWLSETLFMAVVVAALVFFGSSFVERVISAWSIIFYITYCLLCVLVVSRFGSHLQHALVSESLRPAAALWNGLSYTSYNIPLLPVLIFVARNFRNRREALLAGALAGPLILLPGFVFLLTLSAFYPDIVSASLPIQVVLERLGRPALTTAVRLVILGALIKTGAGLLHGFNERLAHSAGERGRPLPRALRPIVAVALMSAAIFAATHIGLVVLIGKGYRYSALYYLVVLVIPMLTIGLWRLLRGSAAGTDSHRQTHCRAGVSGEATQPLR